MPVAALIALVVAVGLLAVVSRSGYGVAPRVFFALALAFALVAATSAGAAAALAAALVSIALGGITTIVDRRRMRSGL
ncbi:MAG: hypothetical protein NVSMB19_06840 [Vulcanimicrobiaceae bacterium]